MKTLKLAAFAAASLAALTATAKDGTGYKVYINPGHGGHESNDRNVVIAPYVQGDPNGYWESNSNLSKGLQLRELLEEQGYAVEMSRTENTEADDLNLSTIVYLSNQSKANIFFSIHSNATGTVARRNFPLMLFRGYDADPLKPNDKVLCQILNKYLLQNQATYWTSTTTNCRGDWSFYPSWGTSGLGVLRGNNVTAMLSEGSFHDYIPEAYRLMNDDFCRLEAWHFRKTVNEFLGVDGVDYGIVCGRLNDNRVPRPGDYIMFGDDKLATIQGAKVELVDASGNVVDTYTTDVVDVNGFYFFDKVAPGKYTVRASIETHQPAEGEVTVVADEASYLNLSMAKVRSTPPVVESYSPVWKEGDDPVLCNTPIVIQFNWDMDMAATEKALKIEPAVEGTFTWEDLNYRMIFTPTNPYNISTTYTVTVTTDAMHAGGLHMEQPVTFQFATTDRNFMEIIGSFPKQDEEVHYQKGAIEFRFDKNPNTTPILKQVTCTDSQGNDVSFDKRNMKHSTSSDAYGFFRIPFLKDLTIGETYNLNVSGEMADKDGITIQAPVKIQFKAVDATAEKPGKSTVDAMGDATAYALSEEGSIDVKSATIKADTSDKVGEYASTAFTYAFNGLEGGEAAFERTAHAETVIKDGDIIGIHVNGDLTDNQVYLELTSDVSTKYLPVCNMNFLGWRYFEVPAQVEGDSQLTGIKLTQTPSMMAGAGTFKVGHILTNAGAGVNDITVDGAQGFTVYPNPASDYLIANGGVLITEVELIGLNGVSVAKSAGNVLNVSEIAEGNYLFTVSSAAGRIVRKVAIKH